MTASRALPHHAVDRPALRRLLDEGVERPLTLIVAPAGAGKTVLLTQWAASRPDLAIVWFDASADDDAPTRLAERLVGAIAAAIPEYVPPSAPVVAGFDRLGEPFLDDLAGSLADAGPVVLVFDDLHLLSSSALRADLWRLADLLPANAHLVFSSRIDLQLGWSRHRLEHGMVELRQRELAFDQATTTAVIERVAHRDVDPQVAAAIGAHTEGWAAGVQMMALGLRLSGDAARLADALADSGHLVIEYLRVEVLASLDPARLDALVRLAVLDEVCAELVELLTDADDGGAVLADLERDSLFLVPVAGRPGWFRFHRLFRDLMLQRLHATDAACERRLEERVADWYLQHGDADDAIEYLLRAEQWSRALAILLDLPERPSMTRAAAIVRWLHRIPASVRGRTVEAGLLLALAEEVRGRGAAATEALRGILGDARLSIGERQVALAHLAAAVSFHPHPATFLQAAEQALRLLQEFPDAIRPNLLGLSSRPLLVFIGRFAAGRAHFYLGDLAAARREIGAAVALASYAPTANHIEALGALALVEAFSGRLRFATQLSDDALALARQAGMLSHPAPAHAFLARAAVAIGRGEPDVGGLALEEAVVRAGANQRTQLLWVAHVAAMLVDPGGLQVAHAEPPGPPPPSMRRAITAIEMRRARFRGSPQASPIAVESWSGLAFEEVAALLAAGRVAEAEATMARLDRGSDDPTMPARTVEQRLIRAWLRSAVGDEAGAAEHLTAAVAVAEPERLVNPFARAGPAIVDLVDQLLGAESEFARLVVRRSRSLATRVVQAAPIAEELTARELELLGYLPSRLTIADIAAACYVSTNTIKTHLAHIYRKLDVTGRNAAIERAAELGLLDSVDATLVRRPVDD